MTNKSNKLLMARSEIIALIVRRITIVAVTPLNLAICKSQNGELENRIRGMMIMWRINVGTRGIRMGTQGIKVRMRGIGVGTQGMGVGILEFGDYGESEWECRKSGWELRESRW